MLTSSPVWTRLEDQIGGSDAEYQRWFNRRNVRQLVAAAAIPVAANAVAPDSPAGGAMAVIVLGGPRQQQCQHEWSTYRSPCERLDHDTFLFLGRAGPHAAAADPNALLAERVEELVSHEHGVSHREEAVRRIGELH